MSHKNPVHEAIWKTVVKPALNERKQSVEAVIQHVNYYHQTVDVYWRDPDSGAERETRGVPLPVDGDGLFRQTVEMGDRVNLMFYNGNHANPYVTNVLRKQTGIDYQTKYGAAIPKGFGFL